MRIESQNSLKLSKFSLPYVESQMRIERTLSVLARHSISNHVESQMRIERVVKVDGYAASTYTLVESQMRIERTQIYLHVNDFQNGEVVTIGDLKLNLK